MTRQELAESVVALDPATGAGFDAIAHAVELARVVLFGEATHGDGASFALRSALVAHLHRNGAIDALAWEAGSYDCWRMDRSFAAQVSPVEALRSGVHGIWVAAEVLPLAEYTAASYEGGRPLRHHGFDTQFSSVTSVDTVGGDLRVLLGDAGVAFDEVDLDAVTRLARHSLPFLDQLSGDEHEQARRRLDELTARCRGAAPNSLAHRFLEDVAANDDVQPALNEWVRSRRGADASWEFDETDPLYKRLFVRRDQAMAANLLSLVADQSGGPVGGWLANGHALRNVTSINAGRDPRFTDFATMGGLVHERLGDAVYTIVTTSHHGYMNAGTTRPPEPLSDARPGSLEAELHELGLPYAFLDLRALHADSEWRRPMFWRAWGSEQVLASPTELADGVLFIDEQLPSTPLPSAGADA